MEKIFPKEPSQGTSPKQKKVVREPHLKVYKGNQLIENPELVWVLEGSVGNIQSGRKYGPKIETDRKLLLDRNLRTDRKLLAESSSKRMHVNALPLCNQNLQ